jgi:hypothetical protein
MTLVKTISGLIKSNDKGIQNIALYLIEAGLLQDEFSSFELAEILNIFDILEKKDIEFSGEPNLIFATENNLKYKLRRDIEKEIIKKDSG